MHFKLKWRRYWVSFFFFMEEETCSEYLIDFFFPAHTFGWENEMNIWYCINNICNIIVIPLISWINYLNFCLENLMFICAILRLLFDHLLSKSSVKSWKFFCCCMKLMLFLTNFLLSNYAFCYHPLFQFSTVEQISVIFLFAFIWTSFLFDRILTTLKKMFSKRLKMSSLKSFEQLDYCSAFKLDELKFNLKSNISSYQHDNRIIIVVT